MSPSRALGALVGGLLLCGALALGACGDDSGPTRLDLGNPFDDLPKSGCGASCVTGCCQGTTCLPGTTISGCGVGGLTCRTCGAADQCINGVCVPPTPNCGPSTCALGCCSQAGVCVQSPNEAACGANGGACVLCGTGEVCTPAGKCDSSKPKKYSVTVVGCEITGGCGLGDTCDGIAKVALGTGTAVETPEQSNTTTPVWDFKLFDATEVDLLAQKLMVTILDADTVFNDTVATCEIGITASALSSGELTTACETNVKSLKFTFKQLP